MDKRIKDLFLYNHFKEFTALSTNQPYQLLNSTTPPQISASILSPSIYGRSILINNSILPNSSTNITFESLEQELSFNNFHGYLGSSYSTLYLTILIITCIEILIGNCLLIYAVFSNKLFGNKLTTNHVITSLAVSDLLIGLLIMPYYIFTRFYKITDIKSWHYEVWSNLDASLTTASIYSLCLVTLDRYLAVVRPIKYTRKISDKKVKLCIVIIWIVSFLTTFLSSILMWILNVLITDDKQRTISRRQIENNVYFHISITILTFYFPFLLILYSNFATFTTIKKRLTNKELKIKKIESSNSSQRMLVHRYSDQSNCSTIISQPEQANSSNSSSKLCLKCFTNQNYASINVISGNQLDLNNNAGNFLRNSFKKRFNRRCSLCSCHINRNVEKREPIQYNKSYHFSINKQNFNSLMSSFTWKSFHKTFIERLHQKHKEGLTKNYTFVFKEYKLIKLLLTINICFICCWCPIYIYQELIRFDKIDVNIHIINYLLFLGWLNSGIDPLIYLYLSKKFRKEIKNKLSCLFK